MKLLYFVNELSQKGGIGRILCDKVNWLATNGYEVEVCLLSNPDQIIVYDLNPNVRLSFADLDMRPGNILSRIKLTLKSIRKIKLMIKNASPDIIVNSNAVLVTWILPFVFFKVPKVIELHFSKDGLDKIDGGNHKNVVALVHRGLRRLFYSLYDKLVVLSEHDKKAFGLKNCEVINNFTNFGRQDLSDLSSKRIVMVGRLEREKRVDLMIEVWRLLNKRYQDWNVSVFGDGSERGALEAKVKELGLDSSFRFYGNVDDVKREYLNSSVFCLTSEYEGFCLVLLEAMSCGLPVVAFDVPGLCDGFIQDGNNCLAADFGDVKQFADKLSCLLDDAELRLRLRNSALDGICRFDKSVVMGKWVGLFNGLSREK